MYLYKNPNHIMYCVSKIIVDFSNKFNFNDIIPTRIIFTNYKMRQY